MPTITNLDHHRRVPTNKGHFQLQFDQRESLGVTNVGRNHLVMIETSKCGWTIRATSHRRPIARDHYTSSTLIGGKGGACPSSLHTTLEGPTEYVNARWM